MDCTSTTRVREAAVEAGHAIAAGPALIEHKGWFAGFDDIGTNAQSRPIRVDGAKKRKAPQRDPASKSVSATRSGPISVQRGRVGNG